MIPIRKIAGGCILPSAQGHIVLFNLYCDTSFDGSSKDNVAGVPHEPRTYVIAGFFCSQPVWESVEDRWNDINERFTVPRFHASHLNHKSEEYEGWNNAQKLCYSKSMLQIINDQGNKMYGISCGMLADEYRKIINEEGRAKLGHPYLACFKTCIATIARAMDKAFP